jgi:predicted amidohydrolase
MAIAAANPQRDDGKPSESVPLLIRGGQVFDPDGSRFRRLDVLAQDGKVAKMAPALQHPPGARTIDAGGLLVTPGLVDCHVHAFRWGHLIGNRLQAKARLICRGTIKDGRLLPPEEQEPMPYDFMGR